MRGEEFAGNGADAKAEEVLDLRGGDQDGDAVGESDDDRAGDESHRCTEAGEGHGDEDDAGHERDHSRPLMPKRRDDAGDDDDERSGRPADLRSRAAQRGDEKTGDDGGVEAGLRSDSGGDAEGHGERQGHQADGDAGQKIVQKHLCGVLAQRHDQLGQVRITERHRSCFLAGELVLFYRDYHLPGRDAGLR